MKRTISIAASLLSLVCMLGMPAAAHAEDTCNVGITNEVATVPPAALMPGDTQRHNFRVTACSSDAKITVEWVRVLSSTRFIRDPAARETIRPEQAVPTSGSVASGLTGSTSWTVPTGAQPGHYAVITRYYSTQQASQSEQAGASSFGVAELDVCPNIDGAQPSVPERHTQGADGNCNPEPGVISDPPDLCPNLADRQSEVPTGYQLISGECRIVALPTGEDPQPLMPDAWIIKRANRTVVSTGGRVTYTITIGNRGPGMLIATRVCDALPAGTTHVSHTGAGRFAAGAICWNAGTLAKGARRSYKLTLRVTGSYRARTLTNRACVTAANAAKRCAKVTIRVKPVRREPVGGVTG